MLSSKSIFEVPVCYYERAASSVIWAACVLHDLICIGKGSFPTQKMSYVMKELFPEQEVNLGHSSNLI
jgi:hypothetical protein